MPVLSVPWGTLLPDVGATPSSELPKPWAVFRSQGNERLLPWRGAVSGASYSGNTAAGNPHGPAVRFAGGASDGVQFTYVDQPDRANYAFYLLVRIRAVSSNHTLIGLDGGNPLQVRVNSSFQLEVLSEGSALLATSSYAGFTAGSVHRLFGRMQSGGPLVIVRNGATIISYASGQDIGITQKRITFGRRSTSGETADCDVVEGWHWSGSTPSLEQGRRLTVDPFNTAYEPQQIWVPSGGTVHTVSLSESAAATDAVTGTASFLVALAESATGSDTVTATATLLASLTEAASAADTVTAQATLIAALTEAANAADTVTGQAAQLVALLEAASAADSVSALAVYGATVSESVTAADVWTATLTAVATLVEAASAADAITGTVGSVTHTVSLSETGAATDAYTATAQQVVALAEAAGATDAYTATAQLLAQLAEAAAAGDALTASAQLVALLTAPAAAADAWASPSTYTVTLAELATALDFWSAVVTGSADVHGQLSAARARLIGLTPGRAPQVAGGKRSNRGGPGRNNPF